MDLLFGETKKKNTSKRKERKNMLTISLSVSKKNGKYNKERSYTKKSAPRMYFFCT